ncbi:GntR family transcriptional regulator [Candidatus Calescamantes bacterium]|nr:GntR family transcriptional regulator [Candidatus Calescamantes bacterium]
MANKAAQPVYKKVEEDILRKIEKGELIPDQVLPSEGELSKKYGIGRSSVRVALKNLKDKGLIYSLPGKGSFVKGKGWKNTKRIAFIVPGLENSDFDIYRGIEDTLEKEGYTLVIYNSQRSIERENKNIRHLLEGNEAGAIIFPNWGRINAEAIFELKRANYPFVLIDRYFLGLETDYVVTDNKKGGYLATEYLIKFGHRRIGIICGIECTAVEDRFEGYQSALRDYRILLDLSLVKKVPQNDKYLKEEPSNGGYEEAKELLKEKPTAIFATNDFLARSTLKAIKEEGLSVPEDISVVGFDNQKFSEYLGLTTIAQPFYEMGEKAAQILLKKLKGEKEINKIFLEPKLVIRESCKSIKEEEVEAKV